jgi:2-dehydro-3-deoxygluconokinase
MPLRTGILPCDESWIEYPQGCELDFLSLGALVHRLDPGIIPFRKATECQIHVSGGEFNVAANLSDCFGMRTAIARRCRTIPSAT